MKKDAGSIALSDVRYKQCQLTPTDDKMKPVIILSYPFSQDLANKMRAAWMFDTLGNAVQFEGAIKLPLEYVAATIQLAGTSSKLELVSQKIVKINVQHGDGEEEPALVGTMRVHLPNVDMEDQTAMTNLFDTVRFLMRLNKAAFDVQITPAQGELFKTEPVPGAPIAVQQSHRMDFMAKLDKKNGIVGHLDIVAVDGGYCCAWEIRCPGLQGEPAAGEQVKDDSQVFERRESAIVWGCNEVVEWLNRGLDVSKAAEKKAVETVRQWCFAQAPGLERKEVVA